MQNRLPTVALIMAAVVVIVAGCSAAQTTPRRAARLTIDGATHTTRPPSCRQDQMYRTIKIPDHDGGVEAVMLLSGYRVMPQWVKIRNVDGFTGSFWQGGVGDAHVDLAHDTYTITGSAYGINSSNPNKVVTTEFNIVAEC
ncbi:MULTISPECIES: lipoprotein LpqH [Mycobacterium avium complex (MAC)]|uniref:Lipoprotein LppE n=3 Tax=Mycobacterium avium complex (MAC) TaxID=120793 RepID=A0A7I9Z4Z5_9MYCO|nr:MULTISPECIES: lipoprotein LpqH [Mycobacterium avium complex (MAC)]MCA2321419.1 lipoprotein LpqH [Mycobacterium intracellulare]MCA2342170.1 lipoprotein LpqH [Mycobacterium intracellulare]MDV6976208.1 lipoprotein LpqH [Mycobacterium intracellulare]MDV6981261.1 lipoprotein LpqH [Mycobacterium intracellulare]MDV7013785.1 lipoprotein LpqH [Mycobacterium intracellulare]